MFPELSRELPPRRHPPGHSGRPGGGHCACELCRGIGLLATTILTHSIGVIDYIHTQMKGRSHNYTHRDTHNCACGSLVCVCICLSVPVVATSAYVTFYSCACMHQHMHDTHAHIHTHHDPTTTPVLLSVT